MQIFLNGRFVPEKRAVVSVFDRGFLYGDGLFESVLVQHGRPFRWAEHMERFEHGAAVLGIRVPLAKKRLRAAADELVRRNRKPSAILRLTMSRGVGPRGYSPKNADAPTLVMSLHPFTPPAVNSSGWRLKVASQRLAAGEPLAQFKNCNKLPQIMARTEADAAGADEALLLNTDGFVVEGAATNLFWVERGTVCTPPLKTGILPGVTRALVLELCRSLRIKTRQTSVQLSKLKHAEGIFMSVTSQGVVAARFLDGKRLKQSSLVERIRQAYWQIVEAETAVK